MSCAISDDDVGRQILDVFMQHRIPVSGLLPRNYFFTVRDGDFQRGLNKAVANDWVAIDGATATAISSPPPAMPPRGQPGRL